MALLFALAFAHELEKTQKEVKKNESNLPTTNLFNINLFYNSAFITIFAFITRS